VTPDDLTVLHEDIADILRALGLPTHARPYSPHEVIQRDVLPRIGELMATHAESRRSNFRSRD
jgi:hypothetical protein